MSIDPYNRTDLLDEDVVGAMAVRLEERGEDAAFLAMLDEYLGAMVPAGLKRVLDVGCGTGVAGRRLAGRADFSGHVLGIDRSAPLIEVARQQAQQHGLVDKASFEVADASHIAGRYESFDAAILHTLLSHVDEPAAVLEVVARTVRPGGLIAVFDGDYASVAYGGDDPEACERLARAFIEGAVTQPRIMRQLPALLPQLGLKIEQARAHVLAEMGGSSFFASSFDSMLRILPRSGIADADSVARWVQAQRRNIASDSFFGSVNFVTYLLRRT